MVSVQYPRFPHIPLDFPDIGASFREGFGTGYDRQRTMDENTKLDAFEKEAPDLFGKSLESLYGGNTNMPVMSLAALDQSGNQAPPPSSPPNPSRNEGDAGSGYYASIRSAESGGNDNAKNPTSSATGRYQFIESTWDGLMRAHPELGLTPDGRTDPAQQERAIRQFTADNAKVLAGAGIPINPGSLYAAHFLGAGGAADVLTQPDDMPMTSAVPNTVLAANSFLGDMTVGQFKQWAAKKGGNSSGGVAMSNGAGDTTGSLPGGAVASPDSILPPRDVMVQLFKNPGTRPLAVQLAQAGMSLRQDAADPTKQLEYRAKLLELQSALQGKPPEPFTLSPGQKRYDAKGNVIAEGAPKADSNGITIGPDGTVQIGGKIAESQSKDVSLYTRGLDADNQLAALDTQLADFGQQNASLIPLGIGNYLRTPEFRQAKVAADLFLSALLRKDTGAVISDDELKSYGEMFLPVPGDDEGTIQSKRRARQVALLAIRSGLSTADAIAQANQQALGVPKRELTPVPTVEPPNGPGKGGRVAPSGDDMPPPSYTGKNWKYLTPEQRRLWQ